MQRATFRRVIVNRPNLRIPFPDRFADRLRGTTVEAVERRGKYLLIALSSGEHLIMHLGMSGSFRVLDGRAEKAPGRYHHERSKLSAHDHVVFHMSSGMIVTFNDPRRFGFMKLVPRAGLDDPDLVGAAFDR